ncbi:hypothetical protein ACAF76_003145 [Brevibacillus sp. TJ4]|uniref:hypothetical protein n=1 Tax=Brevibacillus sp. TJ4 TaxID=3234853 RepID=UPI0037D101E7
MSTIAPRPITAVLVIALVLVAVASFLLITYSYLNTKEIRSLTAQCYEEKGTVLLEIHNDVTSSYSFACQKH